MPTGVRIRLAGHLEKRGKSTKGYKMNFRDQSVTCAVCGNEFIFTVTEQRQISESAQTASGGQLQAIIPPKECRSCRRQEPHTGRVSGRIKWFSQEKGYGFISRPDHADVFFHRSQVDNEPLELLREGIVVTFDEVSTDRGNEARQVRVEDD